MIYVKHYAISRNNVVLLFTIIIWTNIMNLLTYLYIWINLSDINIKCYEVFKHLKQSHQVVRNIFLNTLVLYYTTYELRCVKGRSINFINHIAMAFASVSSTVAHERFIYYAANCHRGIKAVNPHSDKSNHLLFSSRISLCFYVNAHNIVNMFLDGASCLYLLLFTIIVKYICFSLELIKQFYCMTEKLNIITVHKYEYLES